MPVYVDREAPKLWRRICSETTLEAYLLAEKWKLVLSGLAFQYLHGLAAHGVHYLHRPGPTLQDAGFFILPALGEDKAFLPGPNYHCREGSKLAKIPPPKNALDELSLWGDIWLWGSNIFITYDIHISLCTHLSKIRHTKVDQASGLAYGVYTEPIDYSIKETLDSRHCCCMVYCEPRDVLR